MSSRRSVEHIPALDGLRGLAVLGVVAFHAELLRGGYLGVDLFFVLSGFLITSLLLAERARDGRVSLGAFWARRARRLLPALGVLLVGVAAYAALLARPAELARIRADALATLGYAANWRAIAVGNDYWALFRAPSPLEHMWSLAIEEQFYVAWPLLCAALLALGAKRASPRAPLLVATLALLVTSIALAQLLYRPDRPTARVYFGTDTRASSLLVGGLLAIVAPAAPVAAPRPSRALALAGALALAFLVLAWSTFGGDDPRVYRGGLLATSVAAGVVIAAVTRDRAAPLARLLALAPLRAIGRVSYGLYLFHWPLFVAMTPERVRLHGAALVVARLAASFALAIGSYYAVEMPVRRGAFRGRAALALGAAALVATVGAVVLGTAGARAPEDEGRSDDAPVPSRAGARAGERVLLVGDSVARLLGRDAARAASELGVSLVARGVDGCGLTRGSNRIRLADWRIRVRATCTDWETRWAHDVDEARPDTVLLVLGAPAVGDLDLDGRWLHPCDADFDRAYRESAARAIDVLSARGAAVLVATAPYVDEGGGDFATNRARTDCVNRALEQAVLASPSAEITDLGRRVCPSLECVAKRGGVILRPDGTHFDGEGASIALRWLLDDALPLAELRANARAAARERR